MWKGADEVEQGSLRQRSNFAETEKKGIDSCREGGHADWSKFLAIRVEKGDSKSGGQRTKDVVPKVQSVMGLTK